MIVQIQRNNLAKYLKAYPGIGSFEGKDVNLLPERRRCKPCSYSPAQDFNGHTISWPTIVKSILKIKKT
jgi:hypothetical protein